MENQAVWKACPKRIVAKSTILSLYVFVLPGLLLDAPSLLPDLPEKLL